MHWKFKIQMEPAMFMARVAEQGDRYEDMFDFLKDGVVKQRKKGHFTPDERNLLSVSFKNLVTPKRTTWRTILAVEQSTQGTGAP
jgi:14-3-3 protein epsilon